MGIRKNLIFQVDQRKRNKAPSMSIGRWYVCRNFQQFHPLPIRIIGECFELNPIFKHLVNKQINKRLQPNQTLSRFDQRVRENKDVVNYIFRPRLIILARHEKSIGSDARNRPILTSSLDYSFGLIG